MSTQRFGFGEDKEGEEHWAVVIAGRPWSEPPTQGAVREVEAFVSDWAARSGVPLAYVHMGTTTNWPDYEDDSSDWEQAPGVVGLVLASASYEKPVKVDATTLDAKKLDVIPAAFWEELAAAHPIELGEPGVYLATAGWSIARVYDGDAKLEFQSLTGTQIAGVAAETPELVRLDEAALPATVWLYATYC